MATIKEIAEKS